MASTSFSIASRITSFTQANAAFPAAADTFPISISSGSATGRSSTSMVPGAYPPSEGLFTGRIFKSVLPVNSSALRRILASPTTRGRHFSYSSGRPSAFTAISGPMPAGSPMVIPISGRKPSFFPSIYSIPSFRYQSSVFFSASIPSSPMRQNGFLHFPTGYPRRETASLTMVLGFPYRKQFRKGRMLS